MADNLMLLTDKILNQFSELILLSVLFILVSTLIRRQDIFKNYKEVIQSTFFNLGCILINLAVMLPIIQYSQEFLLDYIPQYLTGLWTNLNELLVIVIAVFAGDFIGYWRHRFEHSRLLWPSHATHHSDEHMTWLTLERFHPINFLSTFVIDTTFLILLGFPPYAVIANRLFRHYYGYFIHADIPWRSRFLEKIFVSPTMHRWHHAKESAAHNTNFATVFSIFDRMFGTHRIPSQCNVPLGVSHKLGKGLLAQMIYPFKPSSYRRYPKHSNRKGNDSEEVVLQKLEN
ncbi:sterol desaturase family protein [Shewanella acanthi]|uniref:sterol desaturase family protein n=1 Tax=Shewanella acanthi TaxID=2864212 RepID=UPI001C6559FA|nr:sterol desaturase family protein [Shewanella acanthi]QYJ79854.1 sterol desaturase family protein [Shewanella acanthi]